MIPIENLIDSTILIVDDIPENLKLLGTVLRKNGYKLLVASSGKQALTTVETKVPDLILLDISMPEMDGYEVCRRLKSENRFADIPIIFLTAKTEIDDIVEGFKLGAVDYITKPFNPGELIARVKTHLELKKSRDFIAKQNEQLIELNANKDKFFSIIAHNLKNPFNGILGFSSFLAKEISSLEKDEVIEFAHNIHSGASKLLELLNNLLEWARIQINGIDFQPSILNFDEEIDNISKIFHPSLVNKKISLKLEIPDNIKLYADKNMFGSIVQNLMTNAIKFTHQGGEISISARPNGEFVYITVKDSGVGIPEEKLGKLFKINEKHNDIGTGGERGTGLGLILCKDMVEKNGGSITVESKKGEGSKFIFSLPKIC